MTKLRSDQIPVTRELLTEERTYYVRVDGSDANDGLTNSKDGAFLTVQKAIDTALTLDLNEFNLIIQITDGTYLNGFSISNSFIGRGTVYIQGNSASPSSVVISTTAENCLTVTAVLKSFYIKDMKLQSTTSGSAIRHDGTGILRFQNIIFGNCGDNHMISLSPSSKIQATGNYSIVGDATYHLLAMFGGVILITFTTVTLTGTPSFSTYASATRLGALQVNGCTFSGPATGRRYNADTNSVIVTGGGGANYLPGNTAGVTPTGGQYS